MVRSKNGSLYVSREKKYILNVIKDWKCTTMMQWFLIYRKPHWYIEVKIIHYHGKRKTVSNWLTWIDNDMFR